MNTIFIFKLEKMPKGIKWANQFCLVCFLISMIFVLAGCKKGWLDVKPQKSLTLPKTIADYQAIMDNPTSTSFGAIPFNNEQASLDEIAAGDFYIADSKISSITPLEVNVYKWANELYESTASLTDWNKPYSRIFGSNVILEGIEKITPVTNTDQIAWNQVKGSALFFRAYNHYNIAQLFCKPYNKATAEVDLGIPLRISSDFNVASVRSKLKEAYDLIIDDLKKAAELLPHLVPDNALYKLRPNKAAAYGMLARVYLSMENYDSAFVYADKSLSLYNILMNYATSAEVKNWKGNTTSTTTMTQFNTEVLFSMRLISYGSLAPVLTNCIVDSNLYNSYHVNDVRKQAFFRPITVTGLKNTYIFRGNYDASTQNLFSGIATDEIYLIRAECNARRGNYAAGMDDLNTLLQNRWLVGFTKLSASNADQALDYILTERRKELCFRGLRWTDLRRLNRDTKFAVTLKRFINGTPYSLASNDINYVFPIPPDVIQLSGIEQNPRH